MFLKQYIQQQNPRRKAFGLSEINPDRITVQEAEDLFRTLDNDMSPEDLHMDGERPRNAAEALAASYTQVFEELKYLGFIPPKDIYHF